MSIDFEKIGREAVIAAYCGAIPDAPKGYELTQEFRIPANEPYIGLNTTGNYAKPYVGTADAAPLQPRLILRRKMVKRVVGWTVRLLGRQPVAGEYYTDTIFEGIPQVYFMYPGARCYPTYEAVLRENTYEEVPEPTE